MRNNPPSWSARQAEVLHRLLPLPASAVAHGGHKIALREAYGVND